MKKSNRGRKSKYKIDEIIQGKKITSIGETKTKHREVYYDFICQCGKTGKLKTSQMCRKGCDKCNPRENNRNQFDGEMRKKIIEMFQNSLSIIQIAEKLDISRQRVSALKKELGIEIKSKWEGIDEKIIEMRKQGKSTKEISEELNIAGLVTKSRIAVLRNKGLFPKIQNGKY